MNKRVLVLGLSTVALVLAAGVAAWLTRSRWMAAEAPVPVAAGSAAADTSAAAAAVAVPDSAARSAAATTDSAAGPAVAVADSAPAQLPHPPAMVGTWYHGDGRSVYGDSLVLVLEDDGTAAAVEQRWTLDKNGWHSSRLERTGGWSMRYRGSNRMDLCTSWTKPTTAESCDRIFLAPDSLSAQGLTMDYAGRHWRRVPARSAAARPTARATR